MFAIKILGINALALILTSSSSHAQSNSIVFAGTTRAATTTGTTANPQTNCRCVNSGTCIRTVGMGFDFRIVNEGANGCTTGQEWCCGPSASLVDTTCGVRKITNSLAQPTGIARYGAYPWQAALLTRDNSYIGSGVLLSPNYVLTAAHKITAHLDRNFIVRLGEWDGQKTDEPYPYQDYTPAQITIHPNFNSGNLWNDLAVIKLDKSVPIASSPNINTACLGAAVPAVGTRCWVTGWGKNAFGPNGNYQSIMKEVDVPIVDQGSCETRLRGTRLGQYFNLDRNSFLCAGGETGKDACTGDGGAPLVCQSANGQWRVIGLVAWGIGCADSGVPGVYVNVPNFKAWITQQTGVAASA